MKLAGKVALITGASAGIGRAAALALASEGAYVGLNYLTYPEAAEELSTQIAALGRECLLLPVDVSDQKAVEAMVREVVSKFGRLDILVTCAVYSDRGAPFHATDMEGFRKTIDVSMWGAYNALRASANQMVEQHEGGAIVIVSSPHARIPFPNCMAYNMAKAAIDMMAQTAALELCSQRIRVNIVHPGWTDTPGERKFFAEDLIQKTAKTLPWGRLAAPEEIARGIAFLVDPGSDYITGSTLTIDGGIQLPWWSKRSSGEL